jgi:hypothetical protein
LKGVKVDFDLLEIYFPSVFSNPLDFVIKLNEQLQHLTYETLIEPGTLNGLVAWTHQFGMLAYVLH